MLAQSSLGLSPPKSSFDEVVLEMENKVKWPIKTEMATGLDVLALTFFTQFKAKFSDKIFILPTDLFLHNVKLGNETRG